MKLKRFKKGNKSFSHKEYIKFVGINISMNTPFMRNNNLIDKEFVNVYTDEDKYYNRIAFEFTNKKDEDSFKLSRTANQDGRFVSASALFKSLKIDHGKYKEIYFEPEKKEVDGKEVFIIKVKK